jgi:CSLREA domain-containing protein
MFLTNMIVRPKNIIAMISILFAIFFVGNFANAATYTVNSNEDSDDGTCDSVYVNSATDCTLEEAIDAANLNSGSDTIEFNINAAFPDDGDGQWTISYTGVLPTITDTTILTAVSVWDTDDDRPGIKITSTATSGYLLIVDSSSAINTKIQGLEIGSSSTTARITAPNVTIGTDCDGTNDSIERNVIYSSNIGSSLNLSNGATDFLIKGNYIGTASDGITATGSSTGGIIIGGTASGGIVGYEEGTSCTAAQARNIIGTIGSSPVTAIDIAGTTSSIRVHGNYIGIGSDGDSDICGALSVGVNVGITADQIYVGTDGDNVNDDSEGNLIGGCMHGVKVTVGPTNVRISGNTIGFKSDGITALGNTSRGIVARSNGIIIGWCDTTINSTICSDSGTLANQANQIGFSGDYGIFMTKDSKNIEIYGNYIGTDSTGTANYGNISHGISVAQSDVTGTTSVGANTANQTNIIKYNGGAGVYIEGITTGSARPATENYNIIGNTISNNASHGIHILGTEFYGTEGPNDNIVSNNTLDSNTGDGIYLEAASPLLDTNVISNNTGYGIRLLSAFEPTKGSYTNPYEALSPQNADRDRMSEPNITSNTLTDNTAGGIYSLDTFANNAATLGTDNTINTNGTFDVRQDWYASVELVNNGNTIAAADANIVLTPNGGIACTGTCTGTNHAALSSTQGIWGPAGITYDDATTWYTLTDYIIGTDGTTTDYNPYSIEVLGTYIAEGNVASYTFDGDDSDDTSTYQLPTGYDTGSNSIHRYQIAEVPVRARTSVIPEIAPVAGSVPTETPEPTTNESQILIDSLEEIIIDFFDGFLIPVGGGTLTGEEEKEIKTLSENPELLEGEVIEKPALSMFTVQVRAFRIVKGLSERVLIHLGAPISAFFFVLGAGAWHTARLEKKELHRGDAHRVHMNYFKGASALSIMLFIAITFTQSSIIANATSHPEPLSHDTVLNAGDIVKFEYFLNHTEGQEEDRLYLHHAFWSNMRPVDISGTEYKNGKFVNLKNTCSNMACTTSLGASEVGDGFNLDLDVRVVKSGVTAGSQITLYRNIDGDRQMITQNDIEFKVSEN